MINCDYARRSKLDSTDVIELLLVSAIQVAQTLLLINNGGIQLYVRQIKVIKPVTYTTVYTAFKPTHCCNTL